MKPASSGRLIAVVVAATFLAGCAGTAVPAITPTVFSTVQTPTARTVSTPTSVAPPATTQPLATATAPQPRSSPTTSALPTRTVAALTASPSPAASTEQPAPVETSVAGDISDTQAFVAYHAATGGYTLDVPEGWARTTNLTDAHFVNKLDGVQVTVADASAAATAATARTREIAALTQNGRAVQVTQVLDVQLPGGPAVFVEYSSNSEPDAVTGKQVRLENNAYLIFHSGKLATLTLWAPVGADNVDQWKRIAESFKWA